MPKPLTIAVDVRDLRLAKTGTLTYLEELCKEFKKMNGGGIRFHFMDNTPLYTGNNKILKLTEHIQYQLWKQLILPIKAFSKNCDIVFCTDNFVPLIHLGYKTIPVFHDAFFFETPQNYGRLWLYKKTAIPAAKKSAYVITPSAWAKKQINHYTKIDNDQLIVVPEGPKTLPENDVANTAQLLQSFSISPAKYILHVGSMFKRKNIPALIEAFAKVKALGYADIKLVLAGPTPPDKLDSDYKLIVAAITNNKLQNEVVITGYLPDADLGKLYSNALLYVFPSINEGFGLPVLEAFSHNLPLLVANNTCLPEIGGDAVLQFDPYDTDDISSKIKMVLDNGELRNNMIAKGTERLKLFSWHNTALQLIAVFKQAV